VAIDPKCQCGRHDEEVFIYAQAADVAQTFDDMVLAFFNRIECMSRRGRAVAPLVRLSGVREISDNRLSD